MKPETRTRELISRLARLDAAGSWEGDLNPTQRAALNYLAHANRFSRSPSHVSSYLGTTRGTTSQSLKSLLLKGYVEEKRSTQDKRVVRYDLTNKGWNISHSTTPLEDVLASLAKDEIAVLQDALTTSLQTALAQNGNQEFGICRTCIHHKPRIKGAYCTLLETELSTPETDQICAEQVRA
ncbi:winged helix-turn-helix transcriptional regulator [Rhodobacteraceae bacterium B1Z28]|uniref:Winged helix-turn-helix transcriptional regulator n=1 Tax=Ruegeria haliotis TaxID=2747601 RepID=A0ABX2PWF7_9RHOB|nr:MarR family winged helix-turn-helix transcriptional regulator [Ruegeria haliotis]NVO58515.1 winged helix-turn-helix transcriptional regulator [Ruegeria haliotis]